MTQISLHVYWCPLIKESCQTIFFFLFHHDATTTFVAGFVRCSLAAWVIPVFPTRRTFWMMPQCWKRTVVKSTCKRLAYSGQVPALAFTMSVTARTYSGAWWLEFPFLLIENNTRHSKDSYKDPLNICRSIPNTVTHQRLATAFFFFFFF